MARDDIGDEIGDIEDIIVKTFSNDYAYTCERVQDKIHNGFIHLIPDPGSSSPPVAILGPHFEEHMPRDYHVILDLVIDRSQRFSKIDWSSWSSPTPMGWPTLTKEWQKWVPRMEYFFADQWRALGIYEAIKITENKIKVDKPLLKAALCFWSCATNTMALPLGPMSPTVLDLATIIGLPPSGMEISAISINSFPSNFRDSISPRRDRRAAKHKNIRFQALYTAYAEVDKNKNPLDMEHAAFLFYWLCKYMLCSTSRQCTLEFAAIADALASGTQLALGPFVLAHLYRCLHDIVMDKLNPHASGPLWIFQLWLRTYFPRASTVALQFHPDVSIGRQLVNNIPSSHLSMEEYFTMFYKILEVNFSVCHSRWFNTAVEVDKNVWGSFIIPRDLHYGITQRIGVEVYLPNYFARQFGFVQSIPFLYPRSLNVLCSWRRVFKSNHPCIAVSSYYEGLISNFDMRVIQPSSGQTPSFAKWWKEYASVKYDLGNSILPQITKGFDEDGLEYNRSSKRARLDPARSETESTDSESESSTSGRPSHPDSSNDNNELPSPPPETANGDAIIKNDTIESLGNPDNGEDRADQLMATSELESDMPKISVYDGHESEQLERETSGRGQDDGQLEDDRSNYNAIGQEELESPDTAAGDAFVKNESLGNLDKCKDRASEESDMPKIPAVYGHESEVLELEDDRSKHNAIGHGRSENELQQELETPLQQASSTAYPLPSETRALLDKLLCHESTRRPQRVETQKSRDALATVKSLVGLSLSKVIEQDLYYSFKEALSVLVCANYFDPQIVIEIEDQLANTDACVVMHKYALKKWHDGLEHEKYKNVIEGQSSRVAELAKLQQSLKEDAMEVAELEGRLQLIRNRMEITAHTIQKDLKDHEVELGLYSDHNQGIQYFSDIKHELEQSIKDSESQWVAWRKLASIL